MNDTAARPGSRPSYWHLALALGAYKLLILASVLALAEVRPDAFSLSGYYDNFRQAPAREPGLAQWFSTWDAQVHIDVGLHGYQAGSLTAAALPLWPATIRLGSLLAPRHVLVVALVLANAFSLLGGLVFHRMVAGRHGTNVADAALLLLMASPGALFLQLPYSESLFLLLVAGFFLGLFEERWGLVAVTSFLLPLTRVIGVCCVLPLAWRLHERRMRSPLWIVPLLGFGAWLAVLYAGTGHPLEGFRAHRLVVNQPSIGNVLDLAGFARAFFHVAWGHGMVNSPLDRALFVLFLCALPALWRADRTYFFYSLGAGLLPAMTNWFLSYTRFFTLCVPVFVVWALQLEASRPRRGALLALAGLSWAVQLVLLVRHVTFRWAG
jgi:hypothetical protein